ncbi:protein-glutamate O-methyltransferase CheR [Leptolyngbya boryana CZ1]|uniref:protein-glutamate O-methyltransferase n=1 Tax=Leptolyngbya boryana CZ1 TaxID=3060204 RepID=A0AA97AS35_LEPBY|nr:protein-glutamate O-methyltransferase CheR [Leptolyngbya boryana]WNZ47154.1 protein-glutamate O-methyltransferase CheR [Leptolyngbya boryana CZ1]
MPNSSFDFEYLRHLVREQSGVVLEPHKDYLATLYLSELATQAGFASLSPFVEYLKTSPLSHVHHQAIEALVIHETSFFRDRYPFEALQSCVLPALIAARAMQKTIHIWCAACSTGQEPYSVAMLIRENFPELSTWTVRIIASDFSQQALDRAEQGRYSSLEVERGLTPKLRDRYFYKTEQSWQIIHEIQQMVEFRPLNLIQSWSVLPKMDVIFLRNVLIYFDVETKRSILNKVQTYLQQDGYLFLGGGETTFHLDSRFEAVQGKTSLYHRLRSA